MHSQKVELKVPLSFKQIKKVVQQLSTEEKLQLSSILWDDVKEEV